MVKSLREAAVAYAAQGLPVFPLHGIASGRCTCGKQHCRRPGKHPRTEHGLKDATTDPMTIERWRTRWPNANIGLATGEISGFDAIDVDPNHGGDETLQQLEAQHGPLPLTPRSLTGGGGEHILLRHTPGLRNSAGIIGRGIDIRADSGYIVAPPSLHHSGRRYAWNVDHHPEDVPIAEAPEWLLALARQPSTEAAEPTASPPERWNQVLSQDCPEGRRNDTLARLSGHLLRHYLHPLVVFELVRLWNRSRCRPPLDEVEVARTFDSICLREAERRENVRA